MTPTQNLEMQVARLEAMLEARAEADALLLSHLTTEKFHADPYINVTDVYNLIRNAQSAMADVEMQPWGWSHPVSSDSKSWKWNRPDGHQRQCCKPHEKQPDPFEEYTRMRRAERQAAWEREESF